MLPHVEDVEEDEEEGGVALIDIFNPFASCDELSSVLYYVTSGCHYCLLYQPSHQIKSFFAELCLSFDVVPTPGIALGDTWVTVAVDGESSAARRAAPDQDC